MAYFSQEAFTVIDPLFTVQTRRNLQRNLVRTTPIMKTSTRPRRHAQHLPHLLFVVLLAVALASCTGDALVDVDPNPPENPDALPFYKLGPQPDSPSSHLGSGSRFVVTNGLIQVNGMIFSEGFGIEGNMSLQFFFGFANHPPYGDNPVHVGLFIYSDEPFDGAVEAGFFEGQTLQFSIDGYDVLVESHDDSEPMLGDGSRTPAYALHVQGFSWEGYENRLGAMGSAPELKFILDYDSLEWEFNLDRPSIWVNDELVKESGSSVKQEPFEFFFLYFGTGSGNHRLLVISDEPFEGAENAGTFEGPELTFPADGNTFRVRSGADPLLGDGGSTPAWVLHLPDFVLLDPDGNPSYAIVMGVTSDLEDLLSRDSVASL